MAVAVYASDLTDIFTDGTITGWSALGGGKSGLNQETDYFIQGTSCLSKDAWASALKGMIYNGGAVTIPTDGAVMMWITHQTANSLDTIANGGLRCLIGSSSTAYKHYYIGGNDTIRYDDRWLAIPINPTVTQDNTTGSPSATVSYMGGLANMVGGPTKGSPFGIDAIRYGRVKFTYTQGDLGNGYATFDGGATYNDATTRTYGQIELSGKSYKIQGLHELGTTATLVDFRDSNRNIIIASTLKVTSGFNAFTINNASSNVEWNNINISSLSTVSRGTFTVVDDATVLLDTCVLTDMGTFSFLTNTTSDGSTFRRCDQITQGGGTITNSAIDSSINAVAVLSDDPSLISNTHFISDGTGHAVEIRPTGAGPFTFNYSGNIDSGYASVNGSTGNETILIHPVTTTADITLNIVGGGTTPTIMEDASYTGTFTLVVQPVTTTITVTDVTTGSAIENARVLVEAFSGGSENYKESVTITNSVNTATVTHTAHGLSTNDKVRIIGADQNEYNGVKTIIVTDVNTYTFTTSGGPTSPATGTITSTTVFINGLTNVSGVISDTRSFGANQPIKGRSRKSTTGNLYKTSPISAIINKDSGLSLTVQMIPDE